MGSHYIKVGNIKFDQDLLDTVCPAAGYTPELICPAAGWVYEPEVWEPPIEVEEQTDQSIILICSNTLSKSVDLRTLAASTYKVYDSAGLMLYTEDKNSNVSFVYNFPEEAPADSYFKIVITPQAGNNITRFYVNNNSSFGKNQPIHAAYFYTPFITAASSAFYSVKSLYRCEILVDMDDCTDMMAMFRDTSIYSFKFPSSLAKLSICNQMFQDSKIRTVNFNFCNLPEALNMSYMFYNATELRGDLIVNCTAPKCYNYEYFAYGAKKIKKLFFDYSVSNVASTVSYKYLIYNCLELTEIITHDFGTGRKDVNFQYFLRNAPLCREILFRGDIRAINTSINASSNMFSLKKITFTGELENLSSSFLSINKECPIEQIIFEKLVIGYVPLSGSQNYNLKEIVLSEPADSVVSLRMLNDYITSFNYPTLRCTFLWLGRQLSSPKILTSIEVDWAGSTWEEGTSSFPSILIRADISAAQLNAIYTALPTAASPTYVQFSDCAGYADSDTSIATAKNYVFS